MRDYLFFVYIMASKPYGTLYVGMTNDLARRGYEHREGLVPGFTKRYGVERLVWFEMFGDVNMAIAREKRIKRWRRDWKIGLIEADNPHWLDLYPGFVGMGPGSRAADAPHVRDDR